MKILLINDNPVVSRLLALCTRGEHIELDEVQCVDAIKDVRYDILFVDDASYTDQVNVLLEDRSIRKKVFISYDNRKVEGFDEMIQKPFLPSQIMKVFENVDMNQSIEETQEEDAREKEELPDIFPLPMEDDASDTAMDSETHEHTEILNRAEIEKIKALLDMDDEIDMSEDEVHLSDEEYEARKVKVIKEQLIAEGLEIVEEDEIVEELSTKALEATEETEDHLEHQNEIELNEDELSRIQDAVVVALGKMKPKKIKKLLKGKKVEIKIKLEDDQ